MCGPSIYVEHSNFYPLGAVRDALDPGFIIWRLFYVSGEPSQNPSGIASWRGTGSKERNRNQAILYPPALDTTTHPLLLLLQPKPYIGAAQAGHAIDAVMLPISYTVSQCSKNGGKIVQDQKCVYAY